ncbi:MAG: amidohydrolase family protein [Cypionkella sp.]
MTPAIVDCYAHVGLPRFQSVADCRRGLDAAAIGRAVLCAFDSAPDLTGIHAAFSAAPNRFRGIGIPLGRDRAEIEAAARAQRDAGFSGLRLSDRDVVERPWLLDIALANGGVAVVAGRSLTADTARALAAGLERHRQANIVGGHFAGGGGDLFDPAVAALFDHPRFCIQFSRHGGFAEPAISDWAATVVDRVGWGRVMWGSETPLLFWRNETMAEALAWVDRLTPSEAERARFLAGNAQRIYFDQPISAAPLKLGFDERTRARPVPAGILANGLAVDQALAGRWIQAWRADGGQDRAGDWLAALLDRALPPLREDSHD